MKRKSYSAMQCPVARTLERVGDWWSLLILRDSMMGVTRFDEFRESLGISPTILSRRLKQLVSSGILERKVSADSPVRVEYLLTELGKAFEPVLLLLHSFGNAHFAPEGASAVVVHGRTGKATDLRVVDRVSGKDASWPEFWLVPGDAAGVAMRSKLATVNSQLGNQTVGT
ncbi:helix-turn-helix transcriptional regulator [Paraburkholderia panacisoli]|uniref:Helix-turn-helix transcriptional regulator n=2 Tax=Paraburkholderia panacisoli TaxID=2603818 RepID=A0A5B0HHL0_9BURK|nr:helix-turn-helix transcriptional regulator [Paraburkholderia panacisoli]